MKEVEVSCTEVRVEGSIVMGEPKTSVYRTMKGEYPCQQWNKSWAGVLGPVKGVELYELM